MPFVNLRVHVEFLHIQMLSADKLPQGLFHPFPILFEVIDLNLNGNLVTGE